MRDALIQFVERLRWSPLIFFSISTLIAFALFYLGWPRLAGLIGLFVGLLFLLFLVARPGQGVAVGSIGPAVAGPLLTQWYVQANSPHLAATLHDSNGAALIQLTTFFASLMGTIAQVIVMLGRDSEAGGKRQLLTGLAFLVLMMMVMFSELTPRDAIAGPVMFLGVTGPPLHGLTWCRLALGMWSICAATYPSKAKATADHEVEL